MDKELFGSLLTVVDSTATEVIGARRTDEFGNEYIYLQGIASVAVGSWISTIILSRTASTTALLVAGAVGKVAIAMAAIVADKFGWFQVVGYTVAAKAISGGDCAAGAALYSTATGGSVDDVVVAGDLVYGAYCTVQEGESPSAAGAIGAYIDNPFVNEVSN